MMTALLLFWFVLKTADEMPKVCWAAGCKSGYNNDTSRHLFSVPADKCRLWNAKIPRDGVLTTKHHICDLHFMEHYIIKVDRLVINGEEVTIPRLHWKLTDDAVLTVFPNLPRYLSSVVSKRPLIRHSPPVQTHSTVEVQHPVLRHESSNEPSDNSLTDHRSYSDHNYYKKTRLLAYFSCLLFHFNASFKK